MSNSTTNLTLTPTNWTGQYGPASPANAKEWFEEYWALIIYFSLVIIYNVVMFSPLGTVVLSLLTGVPHVTGPGGMDRMIMRWPRVMLGTRAPVTAIQSLRCTLQGSVFFATTAQAIALWAMLLDEDNARRRLLYVIMATLMFGAVLFYAQQMRMVYHLNYLCTKRPKPHRHRNRLAHKHLIHHDTGADRGAFILSAEAEMTDAEFEEATEEFKHCQLECEMDLDDECVRMSYILQRAVMSYGFGFRLMVVTLPLMLGIVNDISLAVGSCLLVPFMLYYDIILVHTRAEPEDLHLKLTREPVNL